MIAAQPGVEVRSHRAWTWLLPPSAGVREPAALTLEVRGGRLSGRSAAPGSPTGEALVACPLNGAAVTVLRGAIFGAPSLRAGAALQFRLQTS